MKFFKIRGLEPFLGLFPVRRCNELFSAGESVSLHCQKPIRTGRRSPSKHTPPVCGLRITPNLLALYGDKLGVFSSFHIILLL